MDLSHEVGRRIKQTRQRLNLTLKDIESRVAVSATHVSEIERGKTSPTVGALTKIARAFDLEPSAFLVEDALPDYVVTRASDRSSIRYDAAQMTVQPLTGSVREQSLSAALVEWHVPDDSEGTFRVHAGEEYIYLLEGSLEVTVRDRTVTLEQGDSIHFRADLPHRILNRGGTRCRAAQAWRPVFAI